MEEASVPSPSAEDRKEPLTFAQWHAEQERQLSSQRCFYFYTMYCYYYALYANYPWPTSRQYVAPAAATAAAGASTNSSSLSAEQELANHIAQHISAANRAAPVADGAGAAEAPRIEVRVQSQAGVYVAAASPKSRLFAELLDFLLIYLLKDVVYSLLGMDGPELVLEQLDESLRTSDSAANVVIVRNFDQVIKYTAFYRLMVMVYETLFLAYGLQGFGGATIGKRLVGLSVIYCKDSRMINRERREFFVVPGGNLGFIRSFFRSLIKVTVLFVAYPVMIGILFVANGQTVYDQYSGSLVVETRRVAVPTVDDVDDAGRVLVVGQQQQQHNHQHQQQQQQQQ
eukprot:scpid86692/ scgid22546/ Protein FAM8A1; Autosomal highly conserved protein